ncbi:MAG: hypothetical protein DWQ34_17530 [Planctomycetota bacterium]|nr:MAG: hypothetical protein DWQ34_17530 [Planctomycetota bacterium]REJ94876.1 MAG: hypothetical protein DWQ29_02535 [Planctomycetota bacterium]REK28864.1 MAG: hypothetical protein DWQ41_04750 [Planctomycetota bacterium]REK39702.1 MAG: hypothetical protein DWQ45_02195 [Planctomycetota bacterium]
MVRTLHTAALCCGLFLLAPAVPAAQAPAESPQEKPAAKDGQQPVPLNPEKTVLLDLANKRLLLKTRVALREGVLEMLLCKAQTKEHESILAIDSQAYVIHAGLMALGAEPGSPARFRKEFEPPTGQEVELYVNWTDEQNRPHRVRAQTWIRRLTRRYFEHPLENLPEGVLKKDDDDLRYDETNKLLLWFGTLTEEQRDDLLQRSEDKAYRAAVQSLFEQSQPREMEADWVFAGSGFSRQKDGSDWYQAEAGNLICVANFSDAMLDVTMESSASAGNLLFEPYTERIPPLGTPVTLEMIPVFDDDQDDGDKESD